MARQPFVWEVHVRRELLDDELARLRELPYSLWRDVIDAPLSKTMIGRDGRNYRVLLHPRWDRSGPDWIRVDVALRWSGWRRGSLRDSFTITPDNRLL